MPVDRERRNKAADTLLEYLRGGSTAERFFDECSKLSVEKSTTRGFEVVQEGVEAGPEAVSDDLLEHCIGLAIFGPARLVHSKKRNEREAGWGGFIRTLALLRTNLEMTDIALRPRRVRRYARVVFVAMVAGALGVTGVVTLMTARWIGLWGALLWPVFGIGLMIWHPMLVEKRQRGDPRAEPFLTVAQYEAHAGLVTKAERETFRSDLREPPMKKLAKPWWKVWGERINVVGLSIGMVAFVLVIVALVLLTWPLTLYDQLRDSK